ncbi:MFS family permease [Streptomyces sp. DSM 40167]|uniref:hypothetical protein n=1 Tax=Streptomyces sp. DSM 40167 TaxID=2817708 RepID=UPI00277EAB91|nr:MFS family permease [Streptomyces sp. DSM 40167]
MPARLTVGGGLLLIAAGQFAMAFLDASSGASLVPGLLLVGVGTGLVSPGIAGAALAAVPAERAGMAGGAVNTFRQLGYALGIAVFGTVLTSRMTDTLPHDAAHGLAGGAASALEGVVGEHALRAAFASGLHAAALTAGTVAAVARGAGARTGAGRPREPRPARGGRRGTGRGEGAGDTVPAVSGSYRFGGDYATETYSTVRKLSDPSPCERIFSR